MKLVAEAPLWLALVLTLLLVGAALEDAARLRISNLTCLLILGAAFVAIAVTGPEPALWQNIVVFGALLAAGTALFASGKMGGGDVKLLAASGLWFDIRSGIAMLVTVLLAGGVLALLILTLRMFNWSENAMTRTRLLRPKSGIPYGVAIATGVLMATAMQRG